MTAKMNLDIRSIEGLLELCKRYTPGETKSGVAANAVDEAREVIAVELSSLVADIDYRRQLDLPTSIDAVLEQVRNLADRIRP